MDKTYVNSKEIAQIMGIGINRARAINNELATELKKDGIKLPKQYVVPYQYFKKRYGI